jgi:putative transposase
VDEVFVKINGERHYLWRAVDHEGEVLESVVTKRRNKGIVRGTCLEEGQGAG